ncbi:hypothetical protein [Alkalihalobacillus deserti]|uniref:hypothetical protein n=1 Tax=Alkalihalobacillus deserti TaxID=2879466 RepID=UPI001D13A630|nr:hypothetical protein [Alkalihalobacillus deserti]
MNDILGYDIWGLSVFEEEAEKEKDQRVLSLHNGAVKVDKAFIEEGGDLFYEEMFNNEEYITDVLGVLDGPLSIITMGKD